MGLVQMWDKLSHADLDAAKQQLKSHREEMLRRHAEELSSLESEKAEIETLNQLVGAFAKKFKIATTSSFELAAAGEKEASGEAQVVPGISLLITQSQKFKLRELGIDDEQIRNMKPVDAHRMLGIAS